MFLLAKEQLSEEYRGVGLEKVQAPSSRVGFEII